MTTTDRRRIIVICMLDSVHSARWLSQFQEENIDFLLFGSSPHRAVHQNLLNLIAKESTARYKILGLSRYLSIPLWALDRLLGDRARAFFLRRVILKTQPNLVHAMELQGAGHIAGMALRGAPPGPRLLVTNWGSDIFWFERQPREKQRLIELLGIADAYSCECQRDVSLALDLGFRGEVMPVIPNAGGFSRKDIERPVSSLADRRIIAVKGYHGWVGRAKVALAAIGELALGLHDYRIVVFSANSSTARLAKRIAKRTGLDFTIHKKGQLRHEQVLDLFASAKIYVGISLSDGISTSLLESMAMGAIPVQTSTACCDEWFSSSGVKVDEISVEAVKTAILKGLELAESQELSDLNREIIRTRANAEDISAIAKTFYD